MFGPRALARRSRRMRVTDGNTGRRLERRERARLAGGGCGWGQPGQEREALARAPGFHSGSSHRRRHCGAGEDEEQVGEAVQVDEARAGSARRPPRRAAPRARPAGRRCARRAGARPLRSRPAARSSAAREARRCSSSHHSSRRSIIGCSTRSRSVTPQGTERSAPTSKSSFWIRVNGSRRRSGTSPARTTPSAELSSSTVPNAPIRQSSLETREPSPSEVSPPSPPRV